MQQYTRFSILDSVDSTNNYAMGQVHAGLASHGTAWFANSQTQGKGQRGKAWQSNPGENIILSIALKPLSDQHVSSFGFTASVALTCARFLQSLTGQVFYIKWPNDIYWRDRKAAGILIENIVQGDHWKWAIAGIGINVNQQEFSAALLNPVSLKMITGNDYDPVLLARKLHQDILDDLKIQKPINTIIKQYNALLFKKGEEVKLRKNNIVFKTVIKEVMPTGELITSDAMERHFTFGEIEWLK